MKRLLPILLVFFICVAAHAQTYSDTADPFPEDAALALSATVAQMRGWPLSGFPVSLMPGGRFQFAEKHFRYDGFHVADVQLLELDFIDDNPLHRVMHCMIRFEDRAGRVAMAEMFAEYALYEKQGIMLRDVLVWPLFSPAPRFELLAVSASDFEAAGKRLMQSYEAMHDFARKRSIRSSKGGDVVLLVFAKDRLANNTKVEYILSDDRDEDDVDDSDAQFSVLGFLGWNVAATQGKAVLGDSRSLLFVNVFTTGEDGKRRLTGAFDTMLQPEARVDLFPNPTRVLQAGPRRPGTPQQQTAPQPQYGQPQYKQQAAPRQEGPLGAGRMLLNPVFPEHVQVMQLRLKELGYYRGPIDMEFGPLTKRALGDFAQQKGLPRDQWSLELQKLLFAGSGQ